MKKFLFSLLAVVVSLNAVADEGMWLLPYIQKMNGADMKKRGCKLKAEDIYSTQHSSLKDAIVIFGRGCTGEVVSSEGLLFTNHHCGYGSIQELSSVEHDYLKNGFWAKNMGEEIPVPGLEVRFIREISDVTAEVLGSVPNISGMEEREKIVATNLTAIKKELSEANPDKEIVVKPFFGGNKYFAFMIDVFKDIRFVGAPPTAIGKFGGDTDNWMWPRHTGDFSVFRIYADKDNKAAEYSPENKPYHTDNYLKVSTKGYKEGDFAMIMGFPGSTERYMTSYELDKSVNHIMPQRIYLRGERQAILKEEMASSDEIRIKYAAKYAQSSNYWKNAIGMNRGVKKMRVRERKVAQEESFQAWAEKNTLPEEGYITALSDIKEGVAEGLNAAVTVAFISENFLRPVELLTLANYAARAKDFATFAAYSEKIYKDLDWRVDRRVAKRMFALAKERMEGFDTIMEGICDYDGDTEKLVDKLYDNTFFNFSQAIIEMSEDEWREIKDNDCAMKVFKAIMNYGRKVSQSGDKAKAKVADGQRRYIAGLMLQNPTKKWYPDANFTMRMTYGNILPYSPQDGVEYDYFTTLKGVIDKEDKSNPTDFTVPEKLKELYYKADFGRYADRDGSLHTCFLCNCDITGGNSGSPVLNNRGELIGLAFDGNWEAMSGDIVFEPDVQRTISVDVRYVLFVIEKFGGAEWIINEIL